MAARVLLQRRSLAPLATLALGGMALVPATVFAEAPTDKRKPIYDDDIDLPSANPAPAPPPTALPQPPTEEEPKPRGPSPTDRLAVQVGKARLFLYRCAVAAEDKVNETMDSAFHLEQSFTNTIAALAPPRETGEKLMPGAIYVLVAAMAGSIVTRNRSALLRATMPLALGIGAGWTVLPVTMRNVSDLAWKYEQRFPAVAESHVKLREGIQKGVSFAKVHKEVGVRYVDEKVTDAREAVEGWVKQGK
ncbi:MICOS subunit MIC26 [Tolypocladium ophioglossoides CBS 100239]|uniref:MICOS complex subunit n=1 Tax=Tolypocladium ophioglossoides (strain CBS 100239) TaxID=1163406 RepID=A0A0L0NLS5_TOLOC|nr:MICOS subunit MIC26 [Tolypocladium ophioglossoides CBS 100239]